MRSETRWVRAVGKRPVTTAGTPASSTDPSTWTTYRDVQASQAGDGLGIMLGGGIACIDLDHCLTDDGDLSDRARRIVDAVPGAWIEKSRSGTGLHIFGYLPESRGICREGVEIYSRARFILITGDVWRAGDLIDLTAALEVAMQ
ncbi:bifunctional DNA primase/polymerase [Corynebacterium antarcticum]|uniref:bifunctional DNA primase/polymerase n=1 Tax=Corynebacterium antarcticum TaxID=2800405 RepID=UPI00249EDCF8|nr:hypothetical protein [Corynebacterium antarcticum]